MKNIWSYLSNSLCFIFAMLLLTSCSLTLEKKIPPTGVEWVSQSKHNVKASLEAPLASEETLEATKKAITKYEAIVKAGGWTPLSTRAVGLKLGNISADVRALRRRLCKTEDLNSSFCVGNKFDSYVEMALAKYQARNGLAVTKNLDKLTWLSLNIPAELRLQQLKLNYDRLSNLVEKVTNEENYVLVNIPETKLHVVSDGVKHSDFLVIVGKSSRQSPILDSRIREVIFNPTWTVPTSIVKKDLIPIVRANPNYLAENNIVIYNKHGNQVDQSLLDWHSDEPKGYIYIQEPGASNAMATTKINFHNSHEVYMHDTPDQTVFTQGLLFDSSGCIRIFNIQQLNGWLLNANENWDERKIKNAIKSKETTIVKLDKKVGIHFAYISAWANSAGEVNFRNDIYQKDGDPRLLFDNEEKNEGREEGRENDKRNN